MAIGPVAPRREAPKPQAVVVGGSIAGLSSAHALISAGWRVTVFEKSASPPDGSPTGAGLCLDPQSLRLLSRWIADPHLLDVTFPLAIDLNRLTDSGTKASRTLTRDEDFDFRAAHWSDLHSILLRTLPPGTVLWGHQFMSFEFSDGRSSVVTKARVLRTDEIIGIASDLVVAADGCLSSIRRRFFPDSKLRYSGYYAWRGILDFSGKENDDIILGIRQSYPDLANCLYFDLALATHCVLYELKGHRLNWLWYINGPEPEHKESSLTVKVSDSMIEMMHEEADKVWVPELARVMKETKEPFINIIYDSDPLPKLFRDNVVLVGDAAHPTTPHGLRSTNMSIQDAAALGCCLKKWGWENLSSALEEYQSIRLPVISEQVLHARKLGRIKQGLALNCGRTFDPTTARQEECLQLQQRSMPYFESVPITFDITLPSEQIGP